MKLKSDEVMNTGTPDNRRDFYRITTKGHVQYLTYENQPPSLESFFRHPAYFELMTELYVMDAETNRLLTHLPDKERVTLALFKSLNKKIDLIARTLAIAETDLPDEELQDMDLSEGGMAFATSENLKEGQRLAIKFTAIPGFLSISTLAEVVSVDQSDNDKRPYRIRVNFVDIDDHQRQLIARHILKVQQTARREQTERD